MDKNNNFQPAGYKQIWYTLRSKNKTEYEKAFLIAALICTLAFVEACFTTKPMLILT